MKNGLMIVIAAGGMLLATSSEANAQSWRGGRSSGFGISLNLGSPQGFTNQHNHRHQGNSFGYNSGFQQNSRYRNTGFNSGFGYNSGYHAPIQSYRQSVPNRSYGYSNQYLPVQRYSPQRGYGYGGGRSCGY